MRQVDKVYKAAKYNSFIVIYLATIFQLHQVSSIVLSSG